MRTATHKYNDITVRMPQGADLKPLKAFVEAMGWHFIVNTTVTDNVEAAGEVENELPSKQLRGLFKTPTE